MQKKPIKERCEANELTCISFSYSKRNLECQLYDHDRFDEDDNFLIDENETTQSDWLHYSKMNHIDAIINDFTQDLVGF